MAVNEEEMGLPGLLNDAPAPVRRRAAPSASAQQRAKGEQQRAKAAADALGPYIHMIDEEALGDAFHDFSEIRGTPVGQARVQLTIEKILTYDNVGLYIMNLKMKIHKILERRGQMLQYQNPYSDKQIRSIMSIEEELLSQRRMI